MAAEQQFVSNFNIGGLNLYVNPLLHGYMDQQLQYDGQLIRSVNLDSYPLGAKQKRPGYTTFLDTAEGSQVNTLFSWTKDDGTSIYAYRFSGSTLKYYDAGVGTATTWAVCGNGTFTGTHVGYAVLNNTLICGDGVGSTRHTTNGTSFTNTSLAPAGEFFEQYLNRIYIGGTSSTLFYSTTNDATNWNTSGTSDSSSLQIPGPGKLGQIFKLSNRLLVSKNSGVLYRWDGYNLYDMATDFGPISPYSYTDVEGNGFWFGKYGIYTSAGDVPSLISNPIQREIYNDDQTGIPGTVLTTLQAGAFRYDYFVSAGSIQDDFTKEPLNNGIIKYNYQKNEFLNYQFNDNPTAYTSYRDNGGTQRLLFGNSSGQVFNYGGTALNDNGKPIYSVMEMVFNFNMPHLDKDWRWFWGFFNPGCEAQVQIAFSDTFDRQKKNYIDLGDATSGVVKYRFPTGARSKLLWLRIRDNSQNSRYTFYGCSMAAIFVNPG